MKVAKISIVLVAALVLITGIIATQNASAATFAPKPVNDATDIDWEIQSLASTTTVADLSIDKQASPDPVKVGEELTYHIEITNHGPATSTDVVMRDWLPRGVSFVSASSTPGSCSETDGIVSCQLGDLSSGSSASSTIVVMTERAGLLRNRAAVKSAETPDPFGRNNRVMQITHAIDPNAADLSVIKDGDPDHVNVGEKITYTLEVVNHGSASSTNVTLKDKLPGNVTFVSATSTAGSCGFDGRRTVTCDLGTLEMGEFAVSEIEIIPNRPGTLVNMARVSADQKDPKRRNNFAIEKTRVTKEHDRDDDRDDRRKHDDDDDHDDEDDDRDDDDKNDRRNRNDNGGNGNVIDGTVNRNLELKNGDYTINGTVNGNVEVKNGSITINGDVNGNLEQNGPGGIVIDGGTVKGNVEEKGPGSIIVKGGTIEGNAEEKGPGNIQITDGGSVKGNVEEK